MNSLIVRSNKAEIFTSEEFGQVKTILNDDGTISINAEDAAIGLGWYEEKNGKRYVRWRTFNSYAKGFGFNEEIQKDDYTLKNYNRAIDMLMNWEPSREIELMVTGANVE